MIGARGDILRLREAGRLEYLSGLGRADDMARVRPQPSVAVRPIDKDHASCAAQYAVRLGRGRPLVLDRE